MSGRVMRPVAVLVAGAVALAGCAAPSPGPVGEDDPALASFYDQSVSWQDCEAFPGLQCADIAVPRDYAEPSGEDVTFALYRVPARSASAGTIVMMPGGPGGSGGQWLAGGISHAHAFQLTAAHDLVSYDARGVGASSSYACEDEARARARISLDATPDTPDEEGAYLAALESLAGACAEAAGENLAFVGTRELVRDLDVMRAALGEEALTYYAVSYGALVGSEYARAFPDRVGRAVLDAPRTARDWARPHPSEAFAARFEAVLDTALGECFANPFLDCPLGETRAEARQRLEAMFAELDEHPVDLGATVFTRERAVNALWQGLVADHLWGQLVAALGRASGGEWADLAAFDPSTWAPGYWPTHLMIACADVGAPSVSADDVRTTAAQWAQTYPVFGETFAWGALDCTGWPVGPTLAISAGRVDPGGDVLVIATSGDPVTPPEFVQAMAEQLAGARTVVFPGSDHFTYEASDCIRFAVNAFLLEGTVPDSGACS